VVQRFAPKVKGPGATGTEFWMVEPDLSYAELNDIWIWQRIFISFIVQCVVWNASGPGN